LSIIYDLEQTNDVGVLALLHDSDFLFDLGLDGVYLVDDGCIVGAGELLTKLFILPSVLCFWGITHNNLHGLESISAR
jgi:hypothetical protein